MHDVCDRLDRAIPEQFGQLNGLACDNSALGKTDILKFPPTKNWRPMIVAGSDQGI